MFEKKFTVSEEDIAKLMSVFERLNSRDIWSQVKQVDFTARRFSMGFVNDIVSCELTTEARTRLCKSPTDLPAIVVKYVVKDMSFIKLSRTELVSCCVLLSEHKLTPRLTYVDDKVSIHEYIPSRNYKQEDDQKPETVKQLARVLARVHTLNAPISMDGYRQFKEIFYGAFENKKHIPIFEGVLSRQYLEHLDKKDSKIRDKYDSTFDELNFECDSNFTNKLVHKLNSPLVFSHNDFNRGNRLVTSVDGCLGKEIYLVDFDYATMNRRGFDLGRYFSNYRHLDDMFGDEGFPTDEEMQLFLSEYRAECARIEGKHYLAQPDNSLEHLLLEAKVFSLLAYCSDYVFSIMMFTNDSSNDYFLQAAFNRINCFKKQKQRFIEDGTISHIQNQ